MCEVCKVLELCEVYQRFEDEFLGVRGVKCVRYV